MTEDEKQEWFLHKLENPRSIQPRKYWLIDYKRTKYGHPTKVKYKYLFNKNLVARELDTIEELPKLSIITKISLLEAINQLQYRQQILLLQYYWIGFTCAEIGYLTNTTESNICVRLHNAVTKLRKILDTV